MIIIRKYFFYNSYISEYLIHYESKQALKYPTYMLLNWFFTIKL